jgi:hypothetical protein
MQWLIDTDQPRHALALFDEVKQVTSVTRDELLRSVMRARLALGEYDAVRELHTRITHNGQRVDVGADTLLVRALLADDATLAAGFVKLRALFQRHSELRQLAPGARLLEDSLLALMRLPRAAALDELQLMLTLLGDDIHANEEALVRAINVCRHHGDTLREREFWLRKKLLAVAAFNHKRS